MATPTRRQEVAAAASGASATVNLGAGTAVGDLLVIVHGSDFDTAANMPTPTTSQAVSNKTLRITGDAGTNFPHMKVWSAGVTVAGAQTTTVAPTPSNEEVFNHTYVIDGSTVDLANFVDDAAGGGSSTASTSHIAPALSPLTSDALLICGAVAAGGGASSSYTPPGGMTERTDVTDGTFTASSTATQVLSASGSTGTKTFTFSPTAQAYATASIAIKGAAAGTPGAFTPRLGSAAVPGGFMAPMQLAQKISYVWDAGTPTQASPPVTPVTVSPPFAWPVIPPSTISASQPLGNPATGSPQPLVVSTPWAPRLGTALLFGPGTAVSTVQPLVVSPPFAWPGIPPVTITWSQPLGNPATATPQPLVVGAAWTAQPTRPQLFGPGAPAAVVTSAPTPGPLTVTPAFAWPALPPVTIVTSQPLGNPAVGTPGPLIVSTPVTARVPGALLFGPGAPPPVVSTTATPGPVVVTPPFTPVPVPKTTITWSQPLGNPAVATPQPLVIGPRHAVPPIPGAGLSAAPSAPTVTAVGTPGPLIVGPPWQPAPIPRAYLTWSQPLGRPAVGSPQPLIVGPPFRWPAWTASLLNSTPSLCICVTVRPSSGVTARPSTGTTARPGTGTTARPGSGTTTRPYTGVTRNPCC